MSALKAKPAGPGMAATNAERWERWLYKTAVVLGRVTLGYLFFKLRCEPAPLILGFILGPMMEENLRRAMLLSRGDPTVFVTRPLSMGLLIAAAALIVIVALPQISKKREEAFHEVD